MRNLEKQIKSLRLGSSMAHLTLTSAESSAAFLKPARMSAPSETFVFVLWGAPEAPQLGAVHFSLHEFQTRFLCLAADEVDKTDWVDFVRRHVIDGKPSVVIVMGSIGSKAVDLFESDSNTKGSFLERLWEQTMSVQPSREERRLVLLREILLKNQKIAEIISEEAKKLSPDHAPVIEALYDEDLLEVAWDLSRKSASGSESK